MIGVWKFNELLGKSEPSWKMEGFNKAFPEYEYYHGMVIGTDRATNNQLRKFAKQGETMTEVTTYYAVVVKKERKSTLAEIFANLANHPDLIDNCSASTDETIEAFHKKWRLI